MTKSLNAALRRDTVTLFTGDYLPRLNAISAEVDALAVMDDTSFRRMGENRAAELRAQHEALKAEAESAAMVVGLRSLTRTEWKRLKADHPPRTVERDGVDEETARGDRLALVNSEAALDDLLWLAVEEPEHGTRTDFDGWLDGLSEGDYQRLGTVAWTLSVGSPAGPKSLSASPTPRSGAS